MFNVCTSGPLPKMGQHPHLVDSSHSLTSWTLQQTLTASASSYLQPDSFPSYLYWPLHLAVAANEKTNTHSSATMLSLRILFSSKPVPYVLVYRLWGVMGDHHIAQTVHYNILLALFLMRKHWPELVADTNTHYLLHGKLAYFSSFLPLSPINILIFALLSVLGSNHDTS